MTIKFVISAAIGLILSVTSWRFDKSWRQSEKGFKHFAYEHIFSPIAANYIADNPRKQIAYWRHYV